MAADYKSSKFPDMLRSSFSFTLAISALVIAFSSLLGITAHNQLEVSDSIVSIVSFILIKPGQAISISILACALISLLIHVDYMARIVPKQLMRDVVRLLLPLQQRTLDIVIVILIVLFMYLTYISLTFFLN